MFLIFCSVLWWQVYMYNVRKNNKRRKVLTQKKKAKGNSAPTYTKKHRAWRVGAGETGRQNCISAAEALPAPDLRSHRMLHAGEHALEAVLTGHDTRGGHVQEHMEYVTQTQTLRQAERGGCTAVVLQRPASRACVNNNRPWSRPCSPHC